ncbi:sugar ABC transporter substrate-binding protein [Ornithinimicrobium faecis]|uniref:sugar ABC transporter substrate-binding protein n=1 Tax=Ornithinimicrobium faecis TaxID=2934158 RepID=UPI00211919C9|nr:sugar ABC transporter substrate-binding protein [Ornithinimicrobium sp. HY1745]
MTRTKTFSPLRARLGSLALATTLVATLSACSTSSSGDEDSDAGSADEEADENAGGDNAAEDIHLAFIGADGSQNFTQEMLLGAEAAADEFGVDVQVLAPTALDGQAQVRMMEDAMRTAPDGIAIMSLTPDLLIRTQANAVAEGIPVVSVDVPALEGSNVTTHLGNDNFAAGEMLAGEAIKHLEEQGITEGTAVVASPIPGVPTLDLRAEGMKAAIEAALPDFEVVGPVASAPDPTGNLSAWGNLVSANSDANVFMDAGDAALASLARINRENDGQYLTGAFDLNDAGLEAIVDGTNFASGDPQHFLKGYMSTRVLIENALGEADLPQGWWVLPAALVNGDNVEAVIERQAGDNADKLAYFQPQIDELYADPEIRDLP